MHNAKIFDEVGKLLESSTVKPRQKIIKIALKQDQRKTKCCPT